jgi:hypothetical protein
MLSYKIVQQVKRKPKAFSGLLRKLMVIFAVLIILLGIAISQSFMLPGFLLVVLYFIYATFSERDYEYVLEESTLTISVIFGKKYRKLAHTLNLRDLEVLAPSRHEEVAQYRKDGGNVRLPKYDYTSYDPDTPYYTMIIIEDKKKIKILADFNEEMLLAIKRQYPSKVFS